MGAVKDMYMDEADNILIVTANKIFLIQAKTLEL